MPELGKIIVRGVELTLEASTRGLFTLRADGEAVAAHETLEGAKRKASAELRKRDVEVEVPFALDTGQRGVATGLHGRNRSVLATMDDGTRAQIDSYRVLRGDIPQDTLDRHAEIDREIKALRAEQQRIQREYGISLNTCVAQAIEEKVAKAGAASDDA